MQSPKVKVDEDPQLKHRNFLPEIEHAELGKAKFEAQPMRLSRSPWKLRRASPLMSEHSDYVFGEVLGLDSEEIAELMVEGVI